MKITKMYFPIDLQYIYIGVGLCSAISKIVNINKILQKFSTTMYSTSHLIDNCFGMRLKVFPRIDSYSVILVEVKID